ncbi:hypothetical protein [Streptomyces sp. NPDC001315]|uniref:hypothetical protein n=1 Tax=Streptomyces sp. NPDC001315 TaxID=3364562 RepID=UPI00369083E0
MCSSIRALRAALSVDAAISAGAVSEAYVAAMDTVFLCGAALMALCLVLALRLPKPRPSADVDPAPEEEPVPV